LRAMPSWHVHEAVARDVFSIPVEVTREVNRLVDSGPAHDVGRYMPKGPSLIERLFRQEEAWEKSKKLREAEFAVRRILGRGQLWVDAFLVHHFLDVLGPRAFALKVTGYPYGEARLGLMHGAVADLVNYFSRSGLTARYADRQYLLEKFGGEVFDRVVFHEVFDEWAQREASKELELERSADITKRIEEITRSKLKKIDRIRIPSLWYVDSEEEARPFKLEKIRGDAMYDVSLLAARLSHLLFYALLTPRSYSEISSRFLRTGLDAPASMARDVHKACTSANDDENSCFEAALKEVRQWADLLTTAHLEGSEAFRIQVPERVFEEYARIFAKGYFTVKRIIDESGLNVSPRPPT